MPSAWTAPSAKRIGHMVIWASLKIRPPVSGCWTMDAQMKKQFSYPTIFLTTVERFMTVWLNLQRTRAFKFHMMVWSLNFKGLLEQVTMEGYLFLIRLIDFQSRLSALSFQKFADGLFLFIHILFALYI